MKTRNLLSAGMLTAAVALLISAMPGDPVITKSAGTTVVNTTTLAKDVRGFKGATPLKIYIKKNKVVKVETLKNQETPQYFNKAKALLSKYEGQTVSKAAKLKVDGVTGATFSSKALIKNMQAGLNYYKKHK